MKNLLEKFNKYIQFPGNMFRFGSPKFRNIYFKLNMLLRKRVILKRKIPLDDKNNLINKLSNDGYTFLTDRESKILTKEAVDYSKNIIKEFLPLNQFPKTQKKNYLLDLTKDLSFDINNPLIKLALNENLYKYASNYLGMIPIVGNVAIWHSPNKSSKITGSQMFHLDYTDVKQLKVFIPIFDISKDNGPTFFIGKKKSKIICDKINYKLSNDKNRINDETINKFTKKNEINSITGKSGSILMIDTCNCLHMGSRKARKPRSVIMIQYLTPFSFVFGTNFKKNAQYSSLNLNNLSSEQSLLLGAQ